MNTASNLLDDLAQAWEGGIQEAPQKGDTYIHKSSIEEDYYSIGVAKWALRPDQYRIHERAPKSKPRVVMASWVGDPDHREAYTLQDAGEWESIAYAVDADDLVDPVEMVELPSQRELMEAMSDALGGPRGLAADIAAGAVLELLEDKR